MDQEVKAKIVEAYYESKTDTVHWKCDIGKEELHSLAWPRELYGPHIGVNNSNIPPSLIIEHLEQMIGKDVTLRIIPTNELIEQNLANNPDMDIEQANEMMDEMLKKFDLRKA